MQPFDGTHSVYMPASIGQRQPLIQAEVYDVLDMLYPFTVKDATILECKQCENWFCSPCAWLSDE